MRSRCTIPVKKIANIKCNKFKTLSVSKNVDGKSDRVYQFKKNIVSAKRTIVTDLHFAILLFLLILISLHIFLLLISISLVISLSSQLSLLFSPSISLSLHRTLFSQHSLSSQLSLQFSLNDALSTRCMDLGTFVVCRCLAVYSHHAERICPGVFWQASCHLE